MPLAKRSLSALALATAVACPVFLLGLYLDSIQVRLPAKPWPHLLLLAWVLAEASDAYAKRIAAALALCMVADILLEFRSTGFVYGMAVFLTAQLTFASAFAMRCRQWRPVAALPFVVWLGAAVVVLWPGLAALRLPVMAYMAAIGVMLWRAAAWFAAEGATRRAGSVSGGGHFGAAGYALSGAVVFAVSDTIIAFDRFHAPVAGARYIIIVTYWAALALIAASAVHRTQPEQR